MSLKSNTLTIVLSVAAITAIVYMLCNRKKVQSVNKEFMVAEFFGKPHPSLNPYSHYALWIVPGVQPKIHPPVDKYGAYHISLLPMQPMDLPANFNLGRILLKFPQDINRRWNLGLPNISIDVKHTKSHLAVMVIRSASTLNLLRKFFVSKGWNSLHQHNTMDASTNSTIDNFNMMTLGSDDPYEQATPNAFTYQTTWYLQLVKGVGSHYELIPHQRTMLYAAKGIDG